jgi:hypothetical protein
MKAWLLLGLVWALTPCVYAQGHNISLVGRAAPFPDTHRYGNVWGEGDLVCVGRFPSQSSAYGVAIFDISNPASPVLRANYNPSPTSQNQFQDGAVRNRIGYFGSWNGGGVHIVDLQNPSSPIRLSRISSIIGGHDRVHTLFLDWPYLYTADHLTPVVKVFDVTHASSPRHVRDIVATDPERVHQITVQNSRLYTSGWGGHTDIFDVTGIGSRAPVLLGTILSGTQSHSSWPTEDGNFLVSCRETVGGDVRIFDISDLSRPSLVVTLTPETVGVDGYIPHNPVVFGDLLFVSWYQNGVQVFDISDPSAPRRIGWYDTFPQASTVNFAGNWGVFPFLGLDRVLLSDMTHGLFVVDVREAVAAVDRHPPLIVRGPESVQVVEGSHPVLQVLATGSPPLRYQWRRNNVNLPGAEGAELVLDNVQTVQGGSYTVQVWNDTGTITTAPALLQVLTGAEAMPPEVNSEPSSVRVAAGDRASFSVVASGTPQLFYQWFRNGDAIEGANASTLTLGPVLVGDAGAYTVRIRNGAGEATSEAAELTVDDSGFIYDVKVSVGSHSGVISWRTRNLATSWVAYGGGAHLEASEVAEAGMKPNHAEFEHRARSAGPNLSHSVFISSLASSSTLNFMIHAESGLEVYESPEFSLETAASQEEALPPGHVADWWATHYFGAPREADFTSDADGDGWADWIEYLVGTSPVDPVSRPRVTLQSSPFEVEVVFAPVHGQRQYFLETATDLSGEWHGIPAEPSVNEQGEKVFLVPLPGRAAQFYRVRVEWLEAGGTN